MAYITLDELKEYADFETTTDDNLLVDTIHRAQAIIERYTGRKFEVDTATSRYFDAVADVEGRNLHLDKDLCQVSTVINGDGDEIVSTFYVTVPRNEGPFRVIQLLASSGKAWNYVTDPENAIEVEGYWAYSRTAPEAIQQVCLRLASWLYKQRESDNDLDRPLVADGGVVVMPAKLPHDVLTVLNMYKKPLVVG